MSPSLLPHPSQGNIEGGCSCLLGVGKGTSQSLSVHLVTSLTSPLPSIPKQSTRPTPRQRVSITCSLLLGSTGEFSKSNWKSVSRPLCGSLSPTHSHCPPVPRSGPLTRSQAAPSSLLLSLLPWVSLCSLQVLVCLCTCLFLFGSLHCEGVCLHFCLQMCLAVWEGSDYLKVLVFSTFIRFFPQSIFFYPSVYKKVSGLNQGFPN